MEFHLDDFEKTGVIRDGKFIRVERAIHKETQKPYTLTTIKADKPKFKDEVDWKLKVQHLTRLNHPAVKTVVGYIDNGILPILVDDDTDNIPTFHDLQKFKIHPTHKICLLFSAAFGLKYLHDNNIVHGDFKTKSIYVAKDVYSKVSDYIPFQIIIRKARKEASLKSSVFIAPELYQGSQPTKESDVFAFGTLLFTFYSAKYSMGRKILSSPFSELAVAGERVNIPDIIPLKMQSLIEKCWRQNPSERPTMAEVVYTIYSLWDLCFLAPDPQVFDSVVKIMGGPPSKKNLDLKLHRNSSFQYKIAPFPAKAEKYYSNADCQILNSTSRYFASQIIHLQNLLACYKTSTAELIASYIGESIFVQQPENWGILVENVFYIARVHYRMLKDYSILVEQIIKYSPQLKDFIYEQFFAINDDENCYPAKIPVVMVLYFLRNLGVFSNENIINSIKNVFMKHNSAKYFISLIFCYFAPELYSLDKELYKAMKKMVKEETTNCFFPPGFANFFSRKSDLKKDNWKLLREAIEEHKSSQRSLQIIYEDDYQRLTKMIMSPDDFGPSRIDDDVFEPCIIMHYNPNIAHASPIYDAIKCFQTLQLAKFDLNARDLKYNFLPHFVIASNSEDFYEYLEKKCVEIESSLHTATAYYRYEIFYNLLKVDKIDINRPDKLGYLLINAAVISGNVDVLLYCISNGVSVQQRENFGWTPLHWAAFKSKVSIMKILQGADGIDPNTADDWGITPLHLAAENGSEKCLSELLKYKNLNINAIDKKGQTPLHKAAESGDVVNVSVLLADERVNIEIKDKKGRTAAMLAEVRGMKEAAEIIHAKEKK